MRPAIFLAAAASSAAASAAGGAPPALSGLDVIECAATNGTTPCTTVGAAEWATNYTSLDRAGDPRFTTEFRFVSEDNMIAFENAPFTYAPKYGGFCPMGLLSSSSSRIGVAGGNATAWSADRLGPPADTARGWRVLVDPDTGLAELFVFGSASAAVAFEEGMPDTKHRADALWHGWFGDHGSMPPYGQHGGPFNTACFVGGERDCSVDPQPQPRAASVGPPEAAESAAAPPPPLPANDPTNTSGWVPYAPLTDEFDGAALDPTKWSTDPRVVGWQGRAPGLFTPSNVDVESGVLTMRARAAAWPNSSWPTGFGNFTTSAIHSLDRTAHGMFEVKSRSGSSSVSSSFWFHQNDPATGTWTEIDVFESMGATNAGTRWGMNSSKFCSHVHVFQLDGVNQSDLPAKCGCELTGDVCSAGGCVPMPYHFDSDFHVYGLEWNSTTVVFYADGAAVSSFPAQCLQQPIGLDFDRETMPDWMGLPPTDGTFAEAQPFEIEYVRAWKKAEAGASARE